MWQELFAEMKHQGLMVVAVAFDSREGAARKWIEEAGPGYVTLIDRFHHVAELYNMVNVNQAVWIDEEDGNLERKTTIQISYPAELLGLLESTSCAEDGAMHTVYAQLSCTKR